MWYTADAETVPETGKAQADVFYILPTCVWDWTDSQGRTVHFADVRNPEHIAAMLPSNELAYDIFGKYADFYSPYYRQITLDSWTSDEIAEERFPYAMEDVCRAFDYYMEHWNDGRPFFLAGFSQGAKCVVELLKSLDEDEYSRLIAAYVIGYKVTESDMRNPNIRPAQSADDTGVTVCYNSVESVASVSPGLAASEFCINPLNWSCGPEPASGPGTGQREILSSFSGRPVRKGKLSSSRTDSLPGLAPRKYQDENRCVFEGLSPASSYFQNRFLDFGLCPPLEMT